MVWIAEQLWHDFGGTANAKGFRVLDPHVGVLWGDGIDPAGIQRICGELVMNSFSVECCVFGMGGGLLQRINRDTERFAFKASAMRSRGVWRDVSKEPLDSSKASKAGRLALVRGADGMTTVSVPAGADVPSDDLLHTVFEDGRMTAPTTFDEIRERAALQLEAPSFA
jgi:nicotinamide phosphoribosyltransferase